MSLADSIWEEFPKKVNRKKAIAAIERYLKEKRQETGWSMFEAHAWTMERTREFAARRERSGTPMHYLPHPASFYNRKGPDEPEDSWGAPAIPKPPETPTQAPHREIEAWAEVHWDSIVREYGLPCPQPLIIEKLPTILRDLVEEAWVSR
jgi:hypothetical protein